MVIPKVNGFVLATGATFVTFASGAGVCLFDLDTVGSCIEFSRVWVDKFHEIGNHLIAWGLALTKGAFNW